MPSLVPCSNQTLILSSSIHVFRYGSRNIHQKDMCLEEIGLHAQKLITILNSTVNIIGWNLHGHLMSTRIFTLVMNKACPRAPKIMGKVATAST